MGTIILRGGVEVENPLELALEFLTAYSSYEAYDSSGPASFDESDLRLANRGGARLSAAEIAAILDRRVGIERALRKVHADASLADATSSIPWIALTRLFDAFADIRGIGFSKMTKALHPKRPALIPMLDRVVHAYLAKADPARRSPGRSGSAPPRSSAATNETWIATARPCASSRRSSRAARTGSPRYESSTFLSGPAQPRVEGPVAGVRAEPFGRGKSG
jgi:Family of unknown function (DUF6308)